MKKYWKLGCNWGSGKPNFYDLLKKKSIVICAEHDMQIGDNVAVTNGYTVVALAVIIEDKRSATTIPELESDFSSYKIDYEDWNYVAKCKIYELDASDQFQYPLQQGICQIQKKETIELIKDFFMKKQVEQLREECVQILENNHNLILTGAPGTGKTYLAKQIAKQMIFETIKEKLDDKDKENLLKEQCDFVQFHPSYDYTDFVEGLRPAQDKSGNVGFVRKDGVFKDFCKKALPNSSFELCYYKLLQDIKDSMNYRLLQKSGDYTVALQVNDNAEICWTEAGNSDKMASTKVTLNKLRQLFAKYDTSKKASDMSNINDEIRDIIRGVNSTYYWAVLNEVLRRLEKKYVFIIDEINRGEISKIFGELFFSIDPGYRGEKGLVQTQYQNIVKDGDIFKKGFFVPENVYIIGTMNDIDRSVESMDFAFRRRFAFKEITAEDSQGMLDSVEAWGKDENGNSRKPNQADIDTIKNKMDAINNVIWHKVKEEEKDEDKSIEGFSSAYHIGASYFLKVTNYKNDDGSFDFDKLWEYHLEGLLFEYLRGTTEMAKKLKKLAEAYGYTKADKYE